MAYPYRKERAMATEKVQEFKGEEDCYLCEWWREITIDDDEEYGGRGNGWCERFPPHLIDHAAPLSDTCWDFPVMDQEGGCGEFPRRRTTNGLKVRLIRRLVPNHERGVP